MRRFGSVFSTLIVLVGSAIVAAPSVGASQSATFYAYPTGSGTTCTTAADHCSLDYVLSELIDNYDSVTVHLAETNPANTYNYSSGYLVNSPGAHLNLISDGVGANAAVFDGTGMSTSILTINGKNAVTISGVIFQNGHAENGGAIALGVQSDGGSLTVINSTFHNNSANTNGGAIDAADYVGSGTINIINSTFSNNSAGVNGGAIDIGDWGGRGSLSISGSTFSHNSTTSGNGGAIDAADGEAGGGFDIPLIGSASVQISSSSFTSNTADDCGGAISTANGGFATLSITNSVIENNSSTRGTGGAIDAGDGTGSVSVLTVSDTTFAANYGGDYGGAVSNGEDFATSALATITRSAFVANSATGLGLNGGHEGGAISNGTYGGNGVLDVSYSTFAGNGQVAGTSSNDLGGAIFNGSLGTASLWRSTVTTTSAVANVLYTRGPFWLAGNVLALTNADSCHVHDGTFPTSANFFNGGYNITSDASNSCIHGSPRDRFNVTPHLSTLRTLGQLVVSYVPQVVSPAYKFIPANATFLNNGVKTLLCGGVDQAQGQVAAGERCNSGSVDTVSFGRSVTGTGVAIGRFALNSAVLTPSLKKQIAAAATAIIGQSARGYICIGYTDESGGVAHNAVLSVRRAQAVQHYLQHLLSIRGHGQIQVLAYGAGINQDAPTSPASRKVEVRILS
jgi:predicted outer membrane repeat protein